MPSPVLTVEAIFAFCLGCHTFTLPIRLGVLAEDSCVECADISVRRLVDVG